MSGRCSIGMAGVALGAWLALGIATRTPADATPAAPAAASAAPAGNYLFAYFTRNGQDGLRLALSRDGYHWEPIADGKPWLKPTIGEEKLMRDPSLILGPDGIFHMVWTDAWKGQSIGYASSKDLIHWSPERPIKVMADEPTTVNCWAPVLRYDPRARDYLIIWASTIPGRFPATAETAESHYNHRIYSTTTTDFVQFTPAKVFFDPGYVVIDATLQQVNGRWCMVYKDETLKPVAKKNLHVAWADQITGPYTNISPVFSPPWVEGPATLAIDGHYFVYFDLYRAHHYGGMTTDDFVTFNDITPQVTFPAGCRHGTALAVTQDVVDGLKKAATDVAK